MITTVKRFMKILKKLINSCINGNNINIHKILTLTNKKTLLKLTENALKVYFIQHPISRNSENLVLSLKKSNREINMFQ
jgi:hypothetical protein